MMTLVSTIFQMEVSLTKSIPKHSMFFFHFIINKKILDFYDPDGYYFDKDGKDEFGGFYDSDGFYHPGDKNKHEFEDVEEEVDEDELIR